VASALLTVNFFARGEDFSMQRAQGSQRKKDMTCFFSTSVSLRLCGNPFLLVAAEGRAKLSAMNLLSQFSLSARCSVAAVGCHAAERRLAFFYICLHFFANLSFFLLPFPS